jgi:hypothetical protein
VPESLACGLQNSLIALRLSSDAAVARDRDWTTHRARTASAHLLEIAGHYSRRIRWSRSPVNETCGPRCPGERHRMHHFFAWIRRAKNIGRGFPGCGARLPHPGRRRPELSLAAAAMQNYGFAGAGGLGDGFPAGLTVPALAGAAARMPIRAAALIESSFGQPLSRYGLPSFSICS